MKNKPQHFAIQESSVNNYTDKSSPVKTFSYIRYGVVLFFIGIFFSSFLAFAQPTTQAKDIIIIPISAQTTQLRFDFTGGNGVGRIVILRNATGTYTPTNLSAAPSANLAFPADNTTNEQLLQVKDYYFKKKYLNRILERLEGMRNIASQN